MGIYDRQYVREDHGGGGGGPFPSGMAAMSGWSFNTWIIVINVAVFVLDNLLSGVSHYSITLQDFKTGQTLQSPMLPLSYWGHFSTSTALSHFEVWRFITFQFLHYNLFHILFNMIALYVFGPLVEQYLGSRRYLAFYLLCGCAGAALYLVLNVAGMIYAAVTHHTAPLLLLNDPRLPLVGASAGIFGVLLAAAYLRPNQIITLFLFFILPLSMRIKTLAYGLLLIAIFVLATGGDNAGGQAGHIGGAALGALLIRHANWLNWALWLPLDGLKKKGHHAFGRYSSNDGGREFFTGQPQKKPGFFERRKRAKEQSELDEVDRILAKIANQGMGSLTSREKGILERDTQRKRGS